MDQPSRAQIRLILEDADARTRRAVNDRLKAIYADHAARGLLKSGATIKVAIAAMEEEASNFITTCVDRVAAVAMDMEAFAMIQECAETSMAFLAKKLEGIVTMASGVNRSGQGSDGIGKAAEALFTDSRNQLRRRLEIHRFTFTVPHKPRTTVNLPDPAIAKSRGGKPIAAHWDEMWATIAVALYAGDLHRPPPAPRRYGPSEQPGSISFQG